MAHRVIQWSTGNVGAFALRAILGHPELELAGVWVHSEEKVVESASTQLRQVRSRRRGS